MNLKLFVASLALLALPVLASEKKDETPQDEQKPIEIVIDGDDEEREWPGARRRGRREEAPMSLFEAFGDDGEEGFEPPPRRRGRRGPPPEMEDDEEEGGYERPRRRGRRGPPREEMDDEDEERPCGRSRGRRRR